jgi:hypothetical protein
MMAAFAAGLLAPGVAQAFDWNNNEAAYWYGSTFREPGISKDGAARDIPKNVLSLLHADGYSLGTNFIAVDVLKSSSADPASGSGDGAVEVYVVDRQDFSLNALTGSQEFAFGPVRDVMVEGGVDLNTKNTVFAPYKRMPVAGIATVFDVPGFWRVAALWDKEWDHNGITDLEVPFNSTLRLETSWEVPFAVGATHFTFEGYGIYNGPKGFDGFGAKTRSEVLIHSQVMLDVGAWFDAPKRLKVGGGFQYWLNKFGDDHTTTQGALESAPFARVASEFRF